MASARAACDPQEIRQLCMAADWVHLKLLLYAIGSGALRPENVRSLHAQWRAHTRSFGAPLSAPPRACCDPTPAGKNPPYMVCLVWLEGLDERGWGAGGAHVALQSWHAEWLGRQHHALLAVMRMYCQSITSAHLTPELQAHMLLEGALAAAAERQRLSAAVRCSELGVVLDTTCLLYTSPSPRD